MPAGPWRCQVCAELQRAAEAQGRPVAAPKLGAQGRPLPGVACHLCPKRTGAFKRTGDGRWLHVVCAHDAEEEGGEVLVTPGTRMSEEQKQEEGKVQHSLMPHVGLDSPHEDALVHGLVRSRSYPLSRSRSRMVMGVER
eukprot:jgi/Mesen1/726/ME000011S00066